MSTESTGLMMGGLIGFLLGNGLGMAAGGAREERNLSHELDRALAFGNTRTELCMFTGERRALDISVQLNDSVPPRAYVLAEQRWYLRQAGRWLPDAQTQAEYEDFDLELYLQQLQEHGAISAQGTRG